MVRSVEQSLRGLDDLVRSGKVVCLGVCNTPAWRVAQMQTLADLRGWAPLVALQIEYSLIERTVEHELIPMAAALGLGVLPWSPLGGGVLTGKYGRDDLSQDSSASADCLSDASQALAKLSNCCSKARSKAVRLSMVA